MSSFWDAAALLFLWYRDDDVKQIPLQNQAAMGPSENWGLALVGTISFALWVARISARFPFVEEPEGKINWPMGHREGVEGGNRHQAFWSWVTKPDTIMWGPF